MKFLTPTTYVELPTVEAVRTHCLDRLPTPVDDVVRIVETPAQIGPTDTDEFDFNGAWVFLGGLHVMGDLVIGKNGDGCVVLGVRGLLKAERLWISEASLVVWGELKVERLIVAYYNHGLLRVEGRAVSPLTLSIDHDTRFVGGLDGLILDSIDATHENLVTSCYDADGRIDIGRVWSLSKRGQGLFAN